MLLLSILPRSDLKKQYQKCSDVSILSHCPMFGGKDMEILIKFICIKHIAREDIIYHQVRLFCSHIPAFISSTVADTHYL